MDRMPFAWAKAKSDLRAQHLDTALGQLWTVLNPLLLGLVYALLISIFIGRELDLVTLTRVLGGLFAFYFTRGVISGAASVVVRSGAAIMNSSFPRIALPISNLMMATLTFLPSLAVYAIFHLAAGFPVGWSTLWAFPLIIIMGVTNFGIGLLFSTATVFFRDVASFLPYLLRIWMYLTPVLFRMDDIPDRYQAILRANPLTAVFAAWGEVLFDGRVPSGEFVAWAVISALVSLLLGVWVFITKERSFAVRI
jgi:teichoic acid transport system permease protein